MAEHETLQAPVKDMPLKMSLPIIMDEFEHNVLNDPNALSDEATKGIAAEMYRYLPRYRDDKFGKFALNTSIAFLQAARKTISPSEDMIKSRLVIADRGINVISTFLETTALVSIMHSQRGLPTSDEVASTALNSYDFIESILESGQAMGQIIVKQYLVNVGAPLNSRNSNGSIIDGFLNHMGAKRIDNFELEIDNENDGLKMVPKDYDKKITDYRLSFTSPRDRLINCPGHIYKEPDSGRSFNRRIFDVMTKYAKDRIFPSYIPMASHVLERAYR